MEGTHLDLLYEDIIKTIHEPLLVLDQYLRVVLASPSFYHTFKVKPEETAGRLVYDLGNKQWDIPKLRELLDNILPDNNPFDGYEVEHEFTTIGRRIMLLNARQIERAMGKEQIILLAIEDITERRQLEELLKEHAEHALKESEDRYKVIFEGAAEGILVADIETLRFRYCNQAICEMLGYAEEELIGMGVTDIHPKEALDHVLAEFEAQARGDKLLAPNLPCLRKDGSMVYADIKTTSTIIDSRECNVGFFTDSTERRQLEKQLHHSQQLESIGTLAGGIAHDFNNILSSVLGYTELALDNVEKGTMLEDNLQEVYTAGKRARDLVKQILTFARETEEEVRLIQVDIIVKEVLKFIRSSLPTTIEIKQNIESKSLIMGNAVQVHQIMMNLCTNAAHAIKDGIGVLEISLEDVQIDAGFSPPALGLQPGSYIKLSVSDTGTGIPPSAIGQIFVPYFTTKDVGEGTGLGLSMVYGIVESHSGKITVDSEFGKGTTFSIYLPTTKQYDVFRPYEQSELPVGTERILFVDDDPQIAKMGGLILEGLGYQVIVRTASVEALEFFKEKPNDFDLVITDMTMPNMTGDKLAIELLKVRRNIPVILCTGYSKNISVEKASELGIKAFAYKPMVKSDLAKTVRKVLDEANG